MVDVLCRTADSARAVRCVDRGYAAFTQVDGSETLIPSVFWILIATGGALGGYIGVKVGVVRGSALDYRL
ncbi:hypothetical protein GCM10020255_107900 [Rhodococcus baikonurensis]